MMQAAKSEAGKLNQIPFKPKNSGRINKHGSKKINCRLKDRKIALAAIPMLWKKLDVTIWKPTRG